MGHRMLTNMTTHGGFDVAMAWDPDPKTCCAVEQKFAGVRIGSSAHQVVANPAIDVVYIASPPDSHREYVTAAAAAGKQYSAKSPLASMLLKVGLWLKRSKRPDPLRSVFQLPATRARKPAQIYAGLKVDSINPSVQDELRMGLPYPVW